MADLQLRFHKDLLVLSEPMDALLLRQGVEDLRLDRPYMNLLEPETLHEILKLQMMTGVQCMVTNTPDITRARLAHSRFEKQSGEIAQAALKVTNSVRPQHTIALIGPAGLPIDPASKPSLLQTRDQYAQAARDFGEEGFDAFLISDPVSITDLKCALMGVRMVSAKPILASVAVDSQGNLLGRTETLDQAIEVMNEYEADVVGFTTDAPLETCLSLVDRAAGATQAPLMVSLSVGDHEPSDLNLGFRPVKRTSANHYQTPDDLVDAALALAARGVQFLRAVGKATPAYTGALVVATEGRDATR